MSTETIEPGRPVVLRRGTVLTMNDAHDILRAADVLIDGETIAAVGPDLEVPDGAYEIDGYQVGDGAIGALTGRLQAAYFELVRGVAGAPEGWRRPVYRQRVAA